MMDKKQLTVVWLAAVLLLGGCAIFELPALIAEQKPRVINYAYKNDDKSQPKLEKGMSRKEALTQWGKPEKIIKGIKATAEEVWFYGKILSEKGGFYGLGKHITWELYFRNDALERITRMLRHTNFKAPQETVEYFDNLVDKRLEEDGLK